jgi:hypothetical protein
VITLSFNCPWTEFAMLRICFFVLGLGLLFTTDSAMSQNTDPQLKRLGPPLDVFLAAEREYREENYEKAHKLLSAAWKNGPPGTSAWTQYNRTMAPILRDTGLNVGKPPFYYGLRMLTECVEWRLQNARRNRAKSHAIQLTVLLLSRGEGNAPSNLDELKKGAGASRTFVLNPALHEKNYAVIHESLWLFRDYIAAITDGRLSVETNVVELDFTANLRTIEKKDSIGRVVGHSRLDDINPVWRALDSETRATTDWWWVIYPSAVPDKSPEFDGKEFISGGMGGGPYGRAPCFVIDDLWIVRKPAHMGSGLYTSLERRAYMPQWFQHEFFHHLFREFSEFGLEAKPHQWFDRNTWPVDFQGVFEPDYYAEALHKRILPRGNPPLHVKLRYREPQKSFFAQLQIDEITGVYECTPRKNGWQAGSISLVSAKDGRFRWTNEAGVSWNLMLDQENGVLRTGTDCPYYASHPDNGRAFRLRVRRDPSTGDWTEQFDGFDFLSDTFRPKGPN